MHLQNPEEFVKFNAGWISFVNKFSYRTSEGCLDATIALR